MTFCVPQACHLEGGSAGLIPSQLLEEKRKAFVKRDLELSTAGTSTHLEVLENLRFSTLQCFFPAITHSEAGLYNLYCMIALMLTLIMNRSFRNTQAGGENEKKRDTVKMKRETKPLIVLLSKKFIYEKRCV